MSIPKFYPVEEHNEALGNMEACVRDAPEGAYDQQKHFMRDWGDAIEAFRSAVRDMGFKPPQSDLCRTMEAMMYGCVKEANPESYLFILGESFGKSMDHDAPERERVLAGAARDVAALRGLGIMPPEPAADDLESLLGGGEIADSLFGFDFYNQAGERGHVKVVSTDERSARALATASINAPRVARGEDPVMVNLLAAYEEPLVPYKTQIDIWKTDSIECEVLTYVGNAIMGGGRGIEPVWYNPKEGTVCVRFNDCGPFVGHTPEEFLNGIKGPARGLAEQLFRDLETRLREHAYVLSPDEPSGESPALGGVF